MKKHKLNCICNYCKNNKYNKILTKKFLEKEYLINKKNISEISQEINCLGKTVRKRLIKFNIPLRNMSETIKIIFKNPKNHPNYKDGRSLKINYCIDCIKNKLLIKIKWYAKRCNSCAQKERIKQHIKDCKCYFCKIKRGEKIKILNKTRKKMKANHLNYFGENNPNWKGGKSFEPYPLGWTKTFKEQIRYRDSYKCQLCGCHEVECKTKLHVHHIDYNKENLDLNNLIALCNNCHTTTNGNREYWKKYCNDIINKIYEKINK